MWSSVRTSTMVAPVADSASNVTLVAARVADSARRRRYTRARSAMRASSAKCPRSDRRTSKMTLSQSTGVSGGTIRNDDTAMPAGLE